jgi:hypothetical protein
MHKITYILAMVLAACSACWCLYRDRQIEKEYTGDLRNRIVGARLQEDGIPPYFYKWKRTDGIRYYDPQNFDTLKVSNITATPFFHQLLYPLTGVQQRSISKIWLAIEYAILFAMAFLFMTGKKSRQQKLAVIITSSVFLYSGAWKSHIAAGQIYLLFTFLMVLFFFLIRNKRNYLSGIPAGLCAATLLLVRPNMFFFLLPFIPFVARSAFTFKMIFYTSLLAMVIFAFSSIKDRLYWQDYRYAMAEQLRSHQATGAAVQVNEPDPGFVVWEGWDMHQVANDAARFPYTYNQEHGNVFVFINHVFRIKMPVSLLAELSIAAIAVLLLFFYIKNKAGSYDLNNITLLACSIYMITDLFSPIHRFLYNGVQWLLPLWIIASSFNKQYGWIYMGIAFGLLLNSIPLTIIPMAQSLGEYIIFLFVIVYTFKNKPQTSI